MTEQSLYGNQIQPLRNVAALVHMHTRLKNRKPGLPGMGVFFGFPGLGKTYAASHLAAQYDAIHISVQELWTLSDLLETVLTELSIVPRGRRAQMLRQVNEGLAVAGRTLIVDEADYAVSTRMIEVIRDIHDGSGVPIILIGMENLPWTLRKFEQIHSRIAEPVQAEFADVKDARLLATFYCADVALDDALISEMIGQCQGSARRIAVALNHILEECRATGVDRMTLEEWGDRPFVRDDLPKPRGGYQ